jgi:hypothetical protein
MSLQPRRSLVDVVAGFNRGELAKQFAESAAASDWGPIPPGVYRCRMVDAEFVTSKSGTPGFCIGFAVERGEHTGRRLWHTLWLTPRAMPMAKRDLSKLGVHQFDQLDGLVPQRIVADVRVAVRTDDSGCQRNRVLAFEVVDILVDPTADADFASPFSPDSEGGGK